MEDNSGTLGFEWDASSEVPGSSLDEIDVLADKREKEEPEEDDNFKFFEEGSEDDGSDEGSEDDFSDGSEDTEDSKDDSKETETSDDEDEGDEDEDDEPEKETGGSEKDVYSNLYDNLLEEGIFDKEEDEEPIKDVDDFYERVESKIEKRVDEALSTFFQDELDDDARQFLMFKRNGGKTSDFIQTYSKSGDYESMDITKESAQKAVLRAKLKEEGFTEDEAEDEIETLIELGKLESRAKKYHNKLVEKEKAEKAALLERQEELRRTAAENRKNTYKALQDIVRSGKASNVKLGKSDTSLPDYVLAPASKGEKVSQFAKDLQEVYRDPEKLMLLAKLVREDLELSNLKNAVITSKTRKARKSLTTRRSETDTGEKKRLADFF